MTRLDHPEPVYHCHRCRLDWKEGQLEGGPPWSPEDRCPSCGDEVKRKDLGDLPMWGPSPIEKVAGMAAAIQAAESWLSAQGIEPLFDYEDTFDFMDGEEE